MRHLNLVIGVLMLLASGKAFGFPDTVRHGYTNCTTCHFSPSGGGLLNSYGRSLSRELMSTWGYKDEEQPLHGLVKIPESAYAHFAVGGDSRYLFMRSQRAGGPVVNDEFLMQGQLRFGVFYKNFQVFMSLGAIENPRASSEIRWVSSEHFVIWSPQEGFYTRAGRFEPIYGLRLPDHNLWVKSDFGLQPWAERDAIEFIHEGESQSVSLAGFQSTSATSSSSQTTGYTASIFQTVGEKSRLGLSMKNGEGQGLRKRSTTVSAALTVIENLYLLTEYGRTSENTLRKEVGFARLGYEIYKGVTPFVQGQSRINKDGSGGEHYKYGFGFQWLPRPHFEIQGTYENLNSPSGKSQEGILLIHYYL